MRKTTGLTATVFASLLLLTLAVPVLTAGRAVTRIPAPALNDQRAFDKTLEEHEQLAARKPNDPESWYTLAKYYSDNVQKDATLPRAAARTYVMRALEINERALTLNHVYYEAVSLKSILLRQRAVYEDAPDVRKKLIAESDALAAKAAELLRRYNAGRAGRGGNGG